MEGVRRDLGLGVMRQHQKERQYVSGGVHGDGHDSKEGVAQAPENGLRKLHSASRVEVGEFAQRH